MSNNTKSPRLAAAVEVIAVVVFAMVLKSLMDPLFWRYSGPVSLLTVLALLTVLLRRRGETWSSMGLVPLAGARAKLLLLPQALLTFAVFAGGVALVLFAGEALHLKFMSEIPEGVEARWGDIQGNLRLYLIWVALSWISGGLAEEMFFRGYVITRLKGVFANAPFASVLAVVLSAALFGYGHVYYQGLRGFVTTGVIGLVFGSMFLIFRRNLWPVIIVHGAVDTLSFTARFLQWDM